MRCSSALPLMSFDLVLTSTAPNLIRHKSHPRWGELKKTNLPRGRKSRRVGGDGGGGGGGGWVSLSLQSPLIPLISKRCTPRIKHCQSDVTHDKGSSSTAEVKERKKGRKTEEEKCGFWHGTVKRCFSYRTKKVLS